MTDQRWILDDLPVGIWVGEVPEGRVAYANRSFEQILGMPAVAQSRIGDVPATYRIFDLAGAPYPPEKLPFSRVLATGESVMVDDLVARRPEGDVNIRASGYPVYHGPDRQLSHIVVVFLDITKEVAVRMEREQVEARLQLACNHAPMVVWLTDREGVVTMSEGAGLASLGMRSGDLVGTNLFDFYAEHPTIAGHIRRGLAGESFWYTVEVGEAVYDTWLTPLRGPDGTIVGLSGVSNDVSELRKLQKQAIQNDRVMALGTLAASVAHEINNPLTYVLGSGGILQDEIATLERLLDGLAGSTLPAARAAMARIKESLAPIRSGTERIADITRDLRSFSRPDERSLSPVDVRGAVKSALKLAAKEIEARASLVVELQQTPAVMGNEARLVQVVLNLLFNAIQALGPDRSGDDEVAVRTRSDGSRVVLEISDTGPGVPAADRERIFEPFFSTKEIGKGTGLGLFVSRNIARGFSGELEVDDRPGGGALFRLTLPAAPTEAKVDVAAASPLPAADEAPAAEGHVLLIDDEPMVARVLARELRAAGYRVTAIGDGASGLAALLGGADFDIVFCDLMMKGVTGMDLAETLAKEAPHVGHKVVFMTGGAFSPRARDFVALHAERIVDKPFDVVAEVRRRLALKT